PCCLRAGEGVANPPVESGTNRGLNSGVGFGYADPGIAVETTPEVYLIHAWIRQISPMIWRRILLRSDSTLAGLHDVLQIAFGWSDFHLHCFRIHGRDYGVSRVGGLGSSHEALSARLADFRFRPNEWFLYEGY